MEKESLWKRGSGGERGECGGRGEGGSVGERDQQGCRCFALTFISHYSECNIKRILNKSLQLLEFGWNWKFPHQTIEDVRINSEGSKNSYLYAQSFNFPLKELK